MGVYWKNAKIGNKAYIGSRLTSNQKNLLATAIYNAMAYKGYLSISVDDLVSRIDFNSGKGELKCNKEYLADVISEFERQDCVVRQLGFTEFMVTAKPRQWYNG